MKQKYGCIKSPTDLRNYRICKSVQKKDLPRAFEVRHSHIKDQQEVNSCVAHSLSEILESKDGINYSTGWIYGYRPDNYYQGEGMPICNAIGTLYKAGYLKNEQLDANAEMMEAKEIVDKDLDNYKKQAEVRKISAYAYLKTENEVKQAIFLNEMPVIMAIDIDEGGLKLDKNYIAQVPTEQNDSHAVVCYGWNETGFLIQNSWGEEWGNKGTFVLPYAYGFTEAWSISFKKEKEQIIKKPKVYWLRELIMIIVKLLRNIKR